MFHQALSHELAGRKQDVDTFVVSPKPLVQVGFCGKQQRRTTRPGIAAASHGSSKLTTAALLTSLTQRHHVVAGAEQLEVIEMVDNGHALSLQFPEDRRRQM